MLSLDDAIREADEQERSPRAQRRSRSGTTSTSRDSLRSRSAQREPRTSKRDPSPGSARSWSLFKGRPSQASVLLANHTVLSVPSPSAGKPCSGWDLTLSVQQKGAEITPPKVEWARSVLLGCQRPPFVRCPRSRLGRWIDPPTRVTLSALLPPHHPQGPRTAARPHEHVEAPHSHHHG